MALHTKDMQTIMLTTERNCYFQKHYNIKYCNAEQCRILPSDNQVQQLPFTAVGLQDDPNPEISVRSSR